MNKLFKSMMALLLVLSLSACNKAEESTFKAGEYTGSANGFSGELSVTLTLTEDQSIQAVNILDPGETPSIGGVAIEQLKETIKSAQSTQVDTVASATVTSNAIIEAANQALLSAGIDPTTLTPETSDVVKTEETIDTDVVVIGAGGAGMSAAIKLQQAGVDVIILEKMPMVGGNTVKATGGMNATETSVQENYGVQDSVEVFVADTLKGGYDVNDPRLVQVMAEKSSDAVEWLASIGAPLVELSFSGGATNKRIHRPEGGASVGAYLVDAFSANVEAANIPVYLDTQATEIIMEDGVITGVKASSKQVDYTMNAEAVILATGGFGANDELVTLYREDLKGYVTTNTPGATGDGIVMAQNVGADLTDIEQIQIHPTVEQSTSILITESVRGGGAVLVNQDAVRFTNELLTRDVVSANIIAQEDSYAYLIFDQQLRDSLSAIEKYVDANIVSVGETLEDLANKINLDPTTLTQTIDTWNTYVDQQEDIDFDRTTGMEKNISVAPYYAIKIAPGVHHTMGGVKINEFTNVINVDEQIIPGLFAAGEVVGGVHGANRIGGNAVTDIVVFGQIAADSALSYIQNK